MNRNKKKLVCCSSLSFSFEMFDFYYFSASFLSSLNFICRLEKNQNQTNMKMTENDIKYEKIKITTTKN